MKRVTPADIAKMKARGFCASTIADAKAQLERSAETDRIINTIADAFSGVVLGNGVGLTQARALDDHENEAVCAARRKEDEEADWRRITAESLNIYHDCLHFFDAEGMRFHLPAYLITDLRGEYESGLEFVLTHLDAHAITKFTLLSPQQRLAIRAYLLYIVDDPNRKYHKADIVRSLETYWIESGKTKAS